MSHDWIKETVTAEMGKGGYCDGSSSTNESGTKKNPEKQLEKYEVNKKPSAKPEKGFRSGSILQHQSFLLQHRRPSFTIRVHPSLTTAYGPRSCGTL